MAARALIEKDPAYAKVSARLLLHTVRKEIFQAEVSQADMDARYREYFPKFIKKGVEIGLLNEELGRYDLKRMAAALKPENDLNFDYLGLQTLYDRYFLIDRNDTFSGEGRRIEMPQAFFMRVAMGLALGELDREGRAIEFYNLLSSFDFMSSTPTLFNSGTTHSHSRPAYLTTVADDLDGIYEASKKTLCWPNMQAVWQ